MLSAKQVKCLDLMAEGDKTQVEISQIIKVHKNTISKWKNEDEFIKEYNSLQKNKIRFSLVPEAIKEQKNLIHSKSAMVRYLVTKDILDRAGIKFSEESDITGETNLRIVVDYGD